VVLVLIGAICIFKLPVAQYPNIVPPTVQVSTRYPGASAQTVLDTIALPIELQVNGVPGMIYMQSTSAYDGTYNLTVSFEIGSDRILTRSWYRTECRTRWPHCRNPPRPRANPSAPNLRRSSNSC